MAQQSDDKIQSQIQNLLESAGIPVDVDVRSGVATLTGPVSSERIRQAAIDLAMSVDGVKRIDDQTEFEVISPDTVYEEPADDGGFAYADDDVTDENLPGDEADFSEGGGDSADFIQAISDSEGDSETYFPPTDPVVRPSTDEQDLEVTGGFQSTSMDADPEAPATDTPDRTAMDGDEIIVERDDETVRVDVVRELREDALTTDLTLDVEVAQGVVALRGSVDTIQDAENAEAVVGRVAGVREVQDFTVVEG